MIFEDRDKELKNDIDETCARCRKIYDKYNAKPWWRSFDADACKREIDTEWRITDQRMILRSMEIQRINALELQQLLRDANIKKEMI